MKRGIFATAVAVAIALGPVPAKAVQSSGCFLLGCLFQGRLSGGATRSLVEFREASKYKVGSIIVRTPERALYLVLPEGKAMRYRVGVGREGFQWSGNSRIVNKQEWPGWTPPAEMIKRELEQNHRVIPTFMPGGPNNPLGARALYRRHHLSHPWHQPGRHHRWCGVLGLHSHDERRCDRPLREGQGGCPGLRLPVS